ncbi:probable integral membrane protein [Blastopirellula marina DSM 3645]|uniref:Probable integral membrane protein n=1 Tax=Blastopirellula marina DSM 3645 TaxID=314230 RepID=A3ZZA5_9BACT|nr:probable integral membrane protein [Blastopirellula marina DSM 3645]
MKSDARLDSFLQEVEHGPKVVPGSNSLASGLNFIEMRLLPNEEESRTYYTRRLVLGGFHSPTAISLFMLARLLLMVCPVFIALAIALLGIFPFHTTILVGVCLGFIGILIPELWLRSCTQQRQKRLRESLPDFVDLVVTCLEGGMGAAEAISHVHQELTSTHADLSYELGLVARDGTLGISLDKSFRRMAERTGVEEVRTLSTFLEHSQRFGSAMGEAMHELSDMLRYQREQRAEERAQQASVKILIPTLLFIFPTIFVVLAGPAAIQISGKLCNSTLNADESESDSK